MLKRLWIVLLTINLLCLCTVMAFSELPPEIGLIDIHVFNTGTGHSLRVSWENVNNDCRYDIYRRLVGDRYFKRIVKNFKDEGATTTYIDEGRDLPEKWLTRGATYEYFARISNSQTCNVSVSSKIITAIPQ